MFLASTIGSFYQKIRFREIRPVVTGMNNDNYEENRPEGISKDPDLVLLDQILMKAGGVVPPLASLPEATDEEAARLMKETEDIRNPKPKQRRLHCPTKRFLLLPPLQDPAGHRSRRNTHCLDYIALPHTPALLPAASTSHHSRFLVREFEDLLQCGV